MAAAAVRDGSCWTILLGTWQPKACAGFTQEKFHGRPTMVRPILELVVQTKVRMISRWRLGESGGRCLRLDRGIRGASQASRGVLEAAERQAGV